MNHSLLLEKEILNILETGLLYQELIGSENPEEAELYKEYKVDIFTKDGCYCPNSKITDYQDGWVSYEVVEALSKKDKQPIIVMVKDICHISHIQKIRRTYLIGDMDVLSDLDQSVIDPLDEDWEEEFDSE